MAIESLNIKITPYTVELFFNSYCNSWRFRSDLFQAILIKTNKITPNTYEDILDSESTRLVNFIEKNKIKIKNYVPSEEEIPDIAAPIMHDIDDSSDSDEGEKDYVEQILDEYE